MRERLGYALFLLAIALGLLAILIAGANRIGELRGRLVVVTPPPEGGQIIRLPMTMYESEPYPYPEPLSNVELQGGSVKLIIGAAVIVLIVVGGVLYSRAGGRSLRRAESQESTPL